MAATTFVWQGRSSSGESLSGEMVAASRTELIAQLRRRRIAVSQVREKSKPLRIALPGKNGVKIRDLALFTRQFGVMLKAGLPLVLCLDTLSKQAEKKKMRDTLRLVMQEVESGSTLADALRQHRSVFGELYVQMIHAGESAGVLDTILERLAEYLEKAEALQRKIKSAMMYPAVVLSVAFLACAFMLVAIIPNFAKMFSEFGAQLPLPTRVVLGLSGVLTNFWWAILGAVIGAVVASRRYYKTTAGRMRVDRFLLSAPMFGPIIQKGAVARFTRTLGTLIQSGAPLLESLQITADTSGNMVLREAVLATRRSIAAGNTLAEPLRASGVFPAMALQMVAVGEESGQLDTMLTRVADFYDDEVDVAVNGLTSIIEPVMIVVMGGVVGGMVVAMYLPIFKMVSVMGGE